MSPPTAESQTKSLELVFDKILANGELGGVGVVGGVFWGVTLKIQPLNQNSIFLL
jgi:hypothetical protein